MDTNKKPLELSDEEYLAVFGKSLAAARKKKGLSQLELSLDAGIAKSYLADLERGKRNPSLVSLRKIGKALGLDIRAFLPH